MCGLFHVMGLKIVPGQTSRHQYDYKEQLTRYTPVYYQSAGVVSPDHQMWMLQVDYNILFGCFSVRSKNCNTLQIVRDQIIGASMYRRLMNKI